MKKRVLMLLMGTFLFAVQAVAQQKTVTGKVTSDVGGPMAGAQVLVKGTRIGILTDNSGNYSIRAEVGQVLQFRFIGNAPEERTVGTADVIDVQLRRVATGLDAVVISALGETNVKRAIGSSQQMISGLDIAQTNRENFINALQGRVAGVEVTSTSGVPGASTSITIRGVSSMSGSNQPLMIIDGLPLDNKTLNTGVFISDLATSTAFANRIDFSNRASDINPDDIESMTILKGAEASALYGIDAANGAIVITTKRGKASTGGFEYSNSFRWERTGARPALQRQFGPTTITGGLADSFNYFGAPYAAGTTFYDNIDGFFQTALTTKHNLAFSGAAPDNRVNYRIAVGSDQQAGIVPNSDYRRLSLAGSSQAVVTKWLKADLSMTYSYTGNDQPWKGANGPLIGLLLWPQTDNAKDWLTPGGLRRRVTNAATGSAEIDNPYFNVAKNRVYAKNNRIMTNLGLIIAPWNWGSLKTNIGADNYTNTNLISRNPESVLGYSNNGLLDFATDVTRNVTAQTLLTFNPVDVGYGVSLSGMLGNQVADYRSVADAEQGINYMDPNFVSINNAITKTVMSTAAQRRVVSAFGSAQIDYKKYLYVTLTGRNDWTSTIPPGKNSFFYPSITASFIFSDAFPSVSRWVTGKVRAGYAEVGKDAKPYAYAPSLQAKTTSFAGFGYNFTAPNPDLKPEFTLSHEYGAELSFLDDRLGIDATYYRKGTRDQIIEGLRVSYGSGFVLMNVNAGATRNEGTEISVRATPLIRKDFSWDIAANFDHSFGRITALPSGTSEFYLSDTWLYGNVRSGGGVGSSTRAMTGYFYLRNNAGQLLIDPSTGRPVTSTNFIDRGYDRQPKWTMGVTNTFRYKKASLNFLIDIRRGGDVFNATQHYLTTRGLSTMTLDREVPRVVPGVLRDGKENTATPTVNTIVVIPAVQTGYYSVISEEVFMEKNINWVRLRDVTLRYELPPRYLWARTASVFVTGTDLLLKTNYSGLDPVVNGNSAALGGAGGAGIDYGSFPLPRGFSFGLRVGF